MIKSLIPVAFAANLLIPASSNAGQIDDAATKAWIGCIWAASDRLAMRPEPESIIVSAVYGLCGQEEMAMANGTVGWSKSGQEMVDGYKQYYVNNEILGRILAYRASKSLGQGHSVVGGWSGTVYFEQ